MAIMFFCFPLNRNIWGFLFIWGKVIRLHKTLSMIKIIRYIKGLFVKKNKVTITKMYNSGELERWSNSLVFRGKSLVNDESYFQKRPDKHDICPKSSAPCKRRLW